jgi:hypothetical protein
VDLRKKYEDLKKLEATNTRTIAKNKKLADIKHLIEEHDVREALLYIFSAPFCNFLAR